MTTTITKSNHSHQHFGKRGLCHWKDFPQIADIQIHRAGIHAQTPEIYAQGGMDIRTGGLDIRTGVIPRLATGTSLRLKSM
jgi:adhesin HecA-like repeat protein